MIDIKLDTADFTISQDIKLLQLSCEYFFDDNKWTYNSSDLRRLIDTADYTIVTPKTYDNSINTLNNELDAIRTGKWYCSNPALEENKSKSSISSSHARIFFSRLYRFFYFFQQNLLKEKKIDDEQRKHREATNDFLYKLIQQYSGDKIKEVFDTPTISPNDYAFDIRRLNMSPFFSPLFIGIIGSLSKKNNWINFKNSVLEISSVFYKYQKFDQSFSLYQDEETVLYTYWLDILFPDELSELITKFDKMRKDLDDPSNSLLSHNLALLIEELSMEIFITHIGQSNFYKYMTEKMMEYFNSQINIHEEFINALSTVRSFEHNVFTTYIFHETV